MKIAKQNTNWQQQYLKPLHQVLCIIPHSTPNALKNYRYRNVMNQFFITQTFQYVQNMAQFNTIKKAHSHYFLLLKAQNFHSEKEKLEHRYSSKQ